MAYSSNTITYMAYTGETEGGLVDAFSTKPWLYAHVDAVVSIGAGGLFNSAELEINGLLRQVFVTVPAMTGASVTLTLRTEDGQPILVEDAIATEDTTSIVAERILMGRTTIIIESTLAEAADREIVVGLRLQR